MYCVSMQRIALVYCIVALIETFTTKLRPTTLSPGYLSIFTSYRWQWWEKQRTAFMIIWIISIIEISSIYYCTLICMCYIYRLGGFVAFVIYMVTTFSLYVPDWSFVDYNSSKLKRYTVINLSLCVSFILSS